VTWPSKRTIAQACKVSVPTVTRALRELETAGMIITIPRHELNNRQTSNSYMIFTEPQCSQTADLDQEDLSPEVCAIPKLTEPVIEHMYPHMPLEPPISDDSCNTDSFPISLETAPKQVDRIPCGANDIHSSKKLVQQRLHSWRWLSRLYLFCQLLCAHSDMPPRIKMIPHGTISRTKVTLKQRKEQVSTKLTKRIFLSNSKRAKYTLTESSDGG